jgi:uncharacterized protein involved in exopolysaccharide biosynthesis
MDKKREGRLASPFSKNRSLQGPQPKVRRLLLTLLLGFLLGLAFGFRLPLSCHFDFPSFVG